MWINIKLSNHWIGLEPFLEIFLRVRCISPWSSLHFTSKNIVLDLYTIRPKSQRVVSQPPAQTTSRMASAHILLYLYVDKGSNKCWCLRWRDDFCYSARIEPQINEIMALSEHVITAVCPTKETGFCTIDFTEYWFREGKLDKRTWAIPLKHIVDTYVIYTIYNAHKRTCKENHREIIVI